MVAYNFQKQFALPIRSGKKTHTIRRNGKRRHARAGELIQLYTAMRTKACAKILEKDPECVDTYCVQIRVGRDAITSIKVAGQMVDDMEAFAVEDGFANLAAMHAFWLDFHGIGLFEGTLIEWRLKQ